MARAEAAGLAMSCDPRAGELLGVLASAVPRGGRILEVGTIAASAWHGSLTAWGSRSDVEVVSVEHSPDLAAVAMAATGPRSCPSRPPTAARTSDAAVPPGRAARVAPGGSTTLGRVARGRSRGAGPIGRVDLETRVGNNCSPCSSSATRAAGAGGTTAMFTKRLADTREHTCEDRY
jgi:hypothetical protein